MTVAAPQPLVVPPLPKPAASAPMQAAQAPAKAIPVVPRAPSPAAVAQVPASTTRIGPTVPSAPPAPAAAVKPATPAVPAAAVAAPAAPSQSVPTTKPTPASIRISPPATQPEVKANEAVAATSPRPVIGTPAAGPTVNQPAAPRSLTSALASTSVPLVPTRATAERPAQVVSPQRPQVTMPAATVSPPPAQHAASSTRIIGLSPSRPASEAGPRVFLTEQQPIVDAPSIGPKMAERLIPLGLATVGDLLAAQPGNVAARLAMSSVDADMIVDWQDQARLVCSVPGLRGTHAQLLVGAGLRSVDAIATTDADQLCARVLAYAASNDGQRVLRNGDPPDIERIKSWLASARIARAA